MTSGFVYTPGGYPDPTSTFIKVWSGSDGKYETVDGKVRVKWNNYTLDLAKESIQLPAGPIQVTASSGAPELTDSGCLPWTGSSESRLQSKLVQAVKGHEFNLAVNLAQSHQLVDMVVGNVRKFSLSLRALRHGDVATAARQLGINNHVSKLKSKDISGRWLELQYGWLPSISDAYEAGKAYEAITKKRTSRITVAHSEPKYLYEGSASPSNYLAPGVAQVSKKIIYEMSEEISSPRSLGLMDPLSVIWEIIPYSFVIDWFLPIGNYLENLAVIPFLEGRFCSVLFQRNFASISAGLTPDYIGCRRVYHRTKLNREVSFGLSTQLPSFNSPIVALSARRIFNAIALGHQRLVS